MNRKMSKVASLSNFSGIGATETTTETNQKDPMASPVEQLPKTPRKSRPKRVSINIKIPQTQKNWLANTATNIRANNDDPVPPNERVFPQHLICIAIDLLKSSDVDWSEISSEKDLRQQLNL